MVALDRVRSGVFGLCASCEEPISPKRLAAVPWASCCIVCQEAQDRNDEADGADLSYVLAA